MLKYESLYRRGCKDYEKFIKASKWIVTNKIAGTENLSDSTIQTLINYSAVQMAIGSKMTKNKYLLKGMLIGGVITYAVLSKRDNFNNIGEEYMINIINNRAKERKHD